MKTKSRPTKKSSIQSKVKISLFLIAIAVIISFVAINKLLNNKATFSKLASASETLWTNYKSATFDQGDFAEWDQINEADGTLTIINDNTEVPPTPVAGNLKIAKAVQFGSQNTGGHYSRTIWNLPDWQEQTYRTEAYFFLPTGFHNAIDGAVQLIGWDTYPTLQEQMRLIIYKSDLKARLFINENTVARQLTGTFTIPENQWVKLSIEQHISETEGWSKVYMNDVLVAEGNSIVCPTNASRCNDTSTTAPVTRIRYGLVAIADDTQSHPLTLYFDNVSLQIGEESSPPDPTPTGQAPEITSSSLSSGRVGRKYYSKINGYDLDPDDILSFSATNLPLGIELESCTSVYNKKQNRVNGQCLLRGTPIQSGTYSVTLTLTDSAGNTDTKNLSIFIRK